MSDLRTALFIHPNPDNVAGQEKCLLHYVGELGGGLRSVVVLPHWGRFADLLVEHGIRVQIIPKPRSLTSVLGGIAYVSRLLRLAAAERAAFIFCNGLYSNPHGAVVARIRRIPVMTYVATVAYNSWDLSRSTWIEPDLYLCVSRSVKDFLVTSGFDGRRCEVIYPNVIESAFDGDLPDRDAVRKELGLDPQAQVIGYVGQIIPRKNVELIVRAAPEVLAKLPRARFLIAGDDLDGKGQHLREIKELAASLGVVDRFVFPGFLLDPRPVYSASDVMVFPSLAEGLGRTMVEALFFRVPGIYSGIPPHQEVITDGDNGLVLREFSPSELAERIVALCQSPELRDRLSRSGRETFARHFSPESFRMTWQRTWKTLVPA
jgi:glycosyltransferase involved in cell wall biosynthesis